jgi:hypothetical protein
MTTAMYHKAQGHDAYLKTGEKNLHGNSTQLYALPFFVFPGVLISKVSHLSHYVAKVMRHLKASLSAA